MNPPPEAYCPCCKRLSDCCICHEGGARYYGEQCKTCRPLAKAMARQLGFQESDHVAADGATFQTYRAAHEVPTETYLPHAEVLERRAALVMFQKMCRAMVTMAGAVFQVIGTASNHNLYLNDGEAEFSIRVKLSKPPQSDLVIEDKP